MTGDKNGDAICKDTCGGTRIKVGGSMGLQSKDLKGKKYFVIACLRFLHVHACRLACLLKVLLANNKKLVVFLALSLPIVTVS